jgi:hypothetical protein
MANYLVVLFKNKIKKRIIKKFITFRKAKEFFNNYKLNSDNTLFPIEIENTEQAKYELGIVEVSGDKLVPIYLTDEFGRNIRVKLEDESMFLFEIVPFYIEESFFDYQKKTKIDSKVFIRNYLSGDGLKMISTLNNKVIVQNDEKVFLFSFKNTNESYRFADFLTQFMITHKRKDCLIVKDSSKAQKKYLYNLLEDKGFDKKYLYRNETTYQKVRPK